ncbi:malonate decarboxylase holo-ACP synthase [Shimwellia pseudoproteus]|uniref:malonate decarboxylase holo-ACP synthase n=1 Tax=Shimwellia pseudoproteus TaxID=570012 RepID=UPI0018EA9FD3|nr:malonate decarboxylase holo-ACP synthase [Shimwellia pseudoproteus]
MKFTSRAHDLLWLDRDTSLEGITANWVTEQWHCGLPVVVRRDVNQQGRIPVGVRGATRAERAAGWVDPSHIVRVVTPEQLSRPAMLDASPYAGFAPLRGARQLAMISWPWEWGITGSSGYALATGASVLHADSDLDVIIRAPHPLKPALLHIWQQQVAGLSCRVDTQLETPHGAMALNEWLRDGRGLLKTNHGPLLAASPWHLEA